AGQLDDLAFAGNTLAVHDLEFGFTEGRRDLVLHHLDPGHVARDFLAILDGANAPDVQADRGVELQRVTAGRGFRATKHHANFHTNLVDENDDGVGTLDVTRELAQRLGHQARLQTDLHLAHLAFDLGLRRERGDGVDHDNVNGARANEHVRDFERL